MSGWINSVRLFVQYLISTLKLYLLKVLLCFKQTAQRKDTVNDAFNGRKADHLTTIVIFYVLLAGMLDVILI